MVSTAIILAGGLGTRLRPLTDETPKPLLPIKGKPIIEHTIINLRNHGITNIILSIGYKADRIQQYFGDGSRWGIKISYCIEDEPLGTGGAILKAAQGLTNPFIALNGDNISDFNFSELIASHKQNNTQITLTLYPVEDVTKYGIAELRDNRIIRFIEKPSRAEAPSNLNNAGGYLINPAALKILPEGKSSIERDCFEKLAPLGEIGWYKHQGQWFPTDTLEKYTLANDSFMPLSYSSEDSSLWIPVSELKIKKSSQPTTTSTNQNIFKAYDIRGEWNKDWNNETVSKIGWALATFFKPKVVAIGRDMRTSSDTIFTQLANALINQGVQVRDLGLCSTELAYFANYHYPSIDMSLMITASHNPACDNGLKICVEQGTSIGMDNGLQTIRDLVLSPDNISSNVFFPQHQQHSPDGHFSLTRGTITPLNIWSDYQKFVYETAEIPLSGGTSSGKLRKMRLVVDAGNGMGGITFEKILGSLPHDIIQLYWEPDGSFPHHPADPSEEKNTVDLQRKVVEEHADLGIAYDGDADRVFFIDDVGRHIPGYYLAALMADFILQQTSDAKKESVVYDTRYYWATRAIVQKHQARGILSKVGHTLIKNTMRQHNSLLAIEGSGHSFYRSTSFSESSMITTLLMLKILSQRGPLSALVEPYFQKYPISGEINFTIKAPEQILQKVEQHYNSHGIVNKIDGLSIDYPTWRFNLRSSNTQQLLRLNVEANTKTLVEQKVAELQELITGKKESSHFNQNLN